MKKNTWKPVKGFEGFYEIREDGLVRSLSKRNFRKILSQRIDRGGYLTVKLNRKGKTVTAFVHRLLSEAYISNTKNKPFVNHINGNKLDNSISNLEWVTQSENIQHAYDTGLIKRKYKKVVDTCNGNVFKSSKEAADFCDISYTKCRKMLSGEKRNTTCLQYAA